MFPVKKPQDPGWNRSTFISCPGSRHHWRPPGPSGRRCDWALSPSRHYPHRPWEEREEGRQAYLMDFEWIWYGCYITLKGWNNSISVFFSFATRKNGCNKNKWMLRCSFFEVLLFLSHSPKPFISFLVGDLEIIRGDNSQRDLDMINHDHMATKL